MSAQTTSTVPRAAAPRRLPALFGIAIVLAIVVIAADQGTKFWAVDMFGLDFGDAALFETFVPARPVEVTSFLNWVLVGNRGVSFGLLSGVGPWVFVGIALAVTAGLMVWLARSRQGWLAWAVGLIAGGALGNVIDRARLGAVVDFVDLHVAGYHWPAFNVADSAITIGVGLVVIDALFGLTKKG